jgi:DNA primase
MTKTKWNRSKEEQRHKINRLKEAIDAEQLLNMLGFDICRTNVKEVRAPCKVHGGDNKTAFRMNKETKNWVCFSHGCHEDIGYDVISLVRKVLNLSFPDTITYLENMSGINVHDEASYIKFKRHKDRRDFVEQMKDNRQVPTALVSEEYLENFKKFRTDYFEKLGFPVETLDKFEIAGGYVDKYGFAREVIPIRDVDGVLKAYSCRDITGEADEAYKYILTKKFNKDKVLYNLNNAKDVSKTLIVVEGFKSVWKLDMAGYKNAVACMGSRITEGQQNLLYSHAFNVILLLDGNEAGVKGTAKAAEDMKGKINIRPIFFPHVKRDPGDLDVDELREIIGGYDG